MAEIRPFRAVRPAPALASSVAALPYDVYNRAEAKAFTSNHPLSFLNIDRPETRFSDAFSTYDPAVYLKADQMLREWIQNGTFVQEDTPCYYVYALTMGGRTQTGLAACSSIDDYLNNIIRRHENTRAEKELDRINHVDKTSAQTGPIFLAYRDSDAVNAMIEDVKMRDPLYDFVSEDGIRHAVWRIQDPDETKKLTDLFRKIPNTYIADGHHRAASAVKVGLMRRKEHPDYRGNEEFNYFLSVLFPMSQLKILDYNRVLKDLNGLTENEFLKAVGESFEIEPAPVSPFRPAAKGQFGMFLDEKWYKLTARPKICSSDPVLGLDVSILQDYLLHPVLGIGDPKTDKRIDFVGGIRGLEELERRCRNDCVLAFSMYPTGMHELFDVADGGLLMPPKSTWFEPKLRSGIFIHLFER